MGTSAANKGSPSGVPLVPDWVPPIPPQGSPPPKEENDAKELPSESDDAIQDDSSNEEDTEGTLITSGLPASEDLAPPRRYHGARTSIGRFAASGNKEDLRSALRHFVGSGSGGAVAAARRLGATSHAVGRAYDIVSQLSSEDPNASGLNAKDLQHCSASEAKSRIIEAIQPVDGTQDNESVRESLNWAMNEVLKSHEDANITQLLPDQFDTLISCFISHEIYSHFMLEVGETIFARSGARGVERANEVLSYIRAEVQRTYTDGRAKPANRRTATLMAKAVLEKTFRVFEEYIS